MMRYRPPTSAMVLAACLALTLLAGCASLKSARNEELFDQAHKAFRLMLLQSDFEGAATYIDKRQLAAHTPDFKQLADIQVTDYDIKQASGNDQKTRLTQTVEIQYFRVARPVVKTIRYTEKWVFHPDRKQWRIDNDLPDFQ